MLINLRFDYANNSSSSHSVVIVPPTTNISIGESIEDGFGWQWFVLRRKAEKMRYLMAQLFGNLSKELPANIRMRLAADMCDTEACETHIDHQSQWVLPLQANGFIHEQFFDELKAFVSRDDITIYGGNDNEECLHDQPGDPVLTKLDRDSSKVCYATKDGQMWVLFYPHNGLRIKFTFDDSKPPATTSFPLLVDLKITDYCPYGCGFCYQGSTTQGQHASPDCVNAIMHAVDNLGVLEVALGGGEPTLALRKYWMYPQRTLLNITTRNREFVRTANFKQENISSVAISVDDNNLEDWCSILLGRRKDTLPRFVSLQMILGVNSVHYCLNNPHLDVLAKTLKEYGINTGVTLLGYKTTGRGSQFSAFKLNNAYVYENAAEVLEKKHGNTTYSIALDTLAVQQIKRFVEIPAYLHQDVDGLDSCYIDAVTMRLYMNSYTEGAPFVQLELKKRKRFDDDIEIAADLADQIRAGFQKLRGELAND